MTGTMDGEGPTLTMGLIDGAFTRPVIDGRVGVEGAVLDARAVEGSDLFFRQLHHAEFDSSEMSMSSLCIKHARGDRAWRALPVFTSRNFYHTLALVRRDASIRQPSDLRGKRVGVPEYQQTAAVWARGVLADDFGVQPSDIEWHMERLPEASHAFSTGSPAPAGVTVRHIGPDSSIVQMLADGALDATLFYFGPTTLDRSVMNAEAAAALIPLFPDKPAEGARFVAARGFIPMNHGMVVRRTLVEEHPWLPRRILQAMTAAKDLAVRDAHAFLAPYVSSGLVAADLAAVFQRDLTPYGLEPNRTGLETLMGYLHRQGFTDRILPLEEIFADCG